MPEIHIHTPIFVVMAVAVIAPLLAEIPLGVRVPVIVLEVLLGIAVGPHVLELVQPNAFLEAMRHIGTAAVLFMAGLEIDFARIPGRNLVLAVGGWAASAAIAFAAVSLLHIVPDVNAPMMVVIALTTTSLGALLPILRDGKLLDSPYGLHILAAGTVGEVAPIVACALALSNRYTTWQEFGFLLVFLAIAGVAAAVGMGARPPKVLALLSRTMHASTQLPVRFALFLLAALVLVSQAFGFEGIFGAFAAGMIVGLATRGPEGEPFRVKIDAICFGWFTPFFFILTGADFNLGALTHSVESLILTPTFLLLFLLARGLPVYFYRNALPRTEQVPFGLSCSVASLSLVVVITQVGLQAKHMSQHIAQALIGAAMLSLLIYPTVANALLARRGDPAARPASAQVSDGDDLG